MLYFAYGSNMDEAQMGRRCPDAKIIGRALLKGHVYLINKHGVATVVPEQDSDVHGMIWDISDEDMAGLDYYEGVDEGVYSKEHKVVADEKGERVEALIYIAACAEIGTAPRRNYQDRIVKAAIKHNLPPDYIAMLKSFIL